MGRVRLTLAAVAVAMMGGGAISMAAASAAPVPQVKPHQHWAKNAQGVYVRVGPNACLYGPSIAFDNFHNNGHLGVPGKEKLGIITGFKCGFDPNA